MRRTLVITNDFPPRAGGIQSFVYSLASRQPPGSVVVFASTSAGADGFDASQPFPVVRHPTGMLLPVPSVLRRAREVARAECCTVAWFGAAAPLGLLARGLRAAGVDRFVASSHGHEVSWAMLPAARQLLRRIGSSVDVVTYLGEFTRRRLAPAFGRHPRLVQLGPGVNLDIFGPQSDGAGVRRRLGLGERPTVVCVSRLVARKGQDVLIRALPLIRQRVPGAALLVVGGGPDMPRLQRLAVVADVADDVLFTGAVPAAELPAHYAAGHVFAMPCRTRHLGLDFEGLGLVFLEASASGLPVVAGRSGGSADAVIEGETGYLVDGRSAAEVADRVAALLADPAAARAMGEKGRAWIQRDWRWEVQADRLGRLLRDF